jgi:hypothetical protein
MARELVMKKSHTTKKLEKKSVKKSMQRKKYPLHGKLVRAPGIDKGKAIIMPDFDAPLPEFD